MSAPGLHLDTEGAEVPGYHRIQPHGALLFTIDGEFRHEATASASRELHGRGDSTPNSFDAGHGRETRGESTDDIDAGVVVCGDEYTAVRHYVGCRTNEGIGDASIYDDAGRTGDSDEPAAHGGTDGDVDDF